MDKPATRIRQWSSKRPIAIIWTPPVLCRLTHRRRVLFRKPAVLVVLDTVEGPPGEHWLEQFWHLAALDDVSRFSFSEPAELTEGWRSRAFASKEPAPVLRLTHRGPLPACLAAVVDFSESPASSLVELTREEETFSVSWGAVRVQFPIH